MSPASVFVQSNACPGENGSPGLSLLPARWVPGFCFRLEQCLPRQKQKPGTHLAGQPDVPGFSFRPEQCLPGRKPTPGTSGWALIFVWHHIISIFINYYYYDLATSVIYSILYASRNFFFVSKWTYNFCYIVNGNKCSYVLRLLTVHCHCNQFQFFKVI